MLRKALRLCKKKDACFYARKKLVQLHCDNRDSFNSGLVANFDAKEIKWVKPPAGSRTGSLPHRHVHLYESDCRETGRGNVSNTDME